MNTTFPSRYYPFSLNARLPLLQLLNPRELTPAVILSLAVGLGLAWVSVKFWGWPLWTATAIVLIALLPVGVVKWRQDRLRYGATVMLLSILLVSQGAHTIEHIVQWMQYHVLFWTPRQSVGLLSPANAEWVHFVWNWGVVFVVVTLVMGGMRNGWAYLLLGVAILHTLEHSYMLVRHLQVLGELHDLGVYNITAQGLPGVLGRDGWLARSPATLGTFIRGMPGVTTALRLDVHFWWNVVEMCLLICAGHLYLRRQSDQQMSIPSDPSY
jgi:hypothetical protein